ncbi:MAG: HK97 family phage prohead protease [Myxococcota bacterium]
MNQPASKRQERQRQLKEAAFRQVKADGDDILFTVDVKAEIEADRDRGRIKAYANIKNVWDLYNDRGLDGCYLDAIQEGFKARIDAGKPPSIKVLYQHRWSSPIGLPEHMEEDTHGLLTDSRIVDPNEGLGRRTLILADEGVLDSMSIGFRLKRSDYRWVDVADMSEDERLALPADPFWMPPREVMRYRIYEYSVVTFPGAPGSDIIEVIKSIDRQVWGGWRPEERSEPPTLVPAKSAEGGLITSLSLEGLRALRDGVNAAILAEEAKQQPPASPPVHQPTTELSALDAFAAGLKSIIKKEAQRHV